MEPSKKPQTCRWWHRHPGLLLLLLLCAVLAAVFARSFVPRYVLFSNDGPLGAMANATGVKWTGFRGTWFDLNSLGSQGLSSNLSITQVILLSLDAVAWAKFFAPLALLVLGLGAGFFFRRLGFSPLASVLGALAAMLNSGFFTAACWGVAPQATCVGCAFVALGLLVREEERFHWLRVVLAGMAVGMGVMEGYDIGALFSMCIAVFVLVQAWLAPGPPARRVVLGISRLLVVVCFAVLIAFQTVSSLIGTQIKGVAGTAQDTRTRSERWDFATQWSLPKVETLGVLVPGLFGYRMDTPNGGNYWGAVGRDAAWDRYLAGGRQGTPPGGFPRFSGGGSYAGVLVLLVAAWAVAQSFRKDKSVFTLAQRNGIWFWLMVECVALLLAFGRYAPFYQLVYALPYFSTIRNPTKFLYFVELAAVILFAYGVHGLSRLYLEAPSPAAKGMARHLRTWWGRVRGFDRCWTIVCVVGVVSSGLAWFVYADSSGSLESYLEVVQFDAATAKAIARFSIGQAGWFVLLLAAVVGLLTLIVSGFFAGSRAGWGGLLLGAVLVLDLGRANGPFIIYWDWPQKYASNGVVDSLRQKPYEQRVAIMPFAMPPQFSLLSDLYNMEWSQHLFLFYKIQSLDIIQMPRMPEDLLAFQGALGKAGLPGLLRRWELTSTRYLLGLAGATEALNQQLDPQLKRFSNALRFVIEPKPGITTPRELSDLTAVVAPDGPYAVIEFAGALPRAGLYAQWIVQTNNAQTLETLVSPGFNPHQTVLVATNLPAPAANATGQSPGTVAYVSYGPKDVVLKADVKTPAVLLLNDKYDPGWQAVVDGRAAPLLRCNFIMRGVWLTPGLHTVEFHFRLPCQNLYVSLGVIALGLGLCGFLALYPGRQPKTGVPG
jgi:hypothetical protein